MTCPNETSSCRFSTLCAVTSDFIGLVLDLTTLLVDARLKAIHELSASTLECVGLTFDGGGHTIDGGFKIALGGFQSSDAIGETTSEVFSESVIDSFLDSIKSAQVDGLERLEDAVDIIRPSPVEGLKAVAESLHGLSEIVGREVRVGLERVSKILDAVGVQSRQSTQGTLDRICRRDILERRESPTQFPKTIAETGRIRKHQTVDLSHGVSKTLELGGIDIDRTKRL